MKLKCPACGLIIKRNKRVWMKMKKAGVKSFCDVKNRYVKMKAIK